MFGKAPARSLATPALDDPHAAHAACTESRVRDAIQAIAAVWPGQMSVSQQRQATYLEELGQGGRGRPKVLVAHNVVAEPGGDLAAIARACKPLIGQDDGPVVMPMSNHPPHRLIHSPAPATGLIAGLWSGGWAWCFWSCTGKAAWVPALPSAVSTFEARHPIEES